MGKRCKMGKNYKTVPALKGIPLAGGTYNTRNRSEAVEETERKCSMFTPISANYLAMPVVKGRKTDSDKFAGAEATYAIEALMHDGKALQAGTSHYFGDGFAKAFDAGIPTGKQEGLSSSDKLGRYNPPYRRYNNHDSRRRQRSCSSACNRARTGGNSATVAMHKEEASWKRRRSFTIS